MAKGMPKAMKKAKLASPTVAGPVLQAAKQPAAAGANPTKAEFDALIAKLVAAGIMAAA